MKVITHIITGLNIGGAERALHTLLTGGMQNHLHNRVISLIDEGTYGPLLRKAGIEVACLGMSPARPSLTSVLRLLRLVRSQKPDIIQGWMYHGNLAASVARRLAVPQAALSWNIRLSLEGWQQAKRSRQHVIRMGKRLSTGPQAIIYNSRRSRLQHEAIGYASAASSHIPNGFDTARWRPMPDARHALAQMIGVAENVKLIGFVARAHPQKDLPNLYGAFQRLSEQRSDCHLVCIGRNLDEAAPCTLDRSRVTFLGQRQNIPELMPAFDFLCLSSWAEGFPNVIGEAMSCGVPCVTTDVGDAADIVGDTGWIVPVHDTKALAEALENALSLPEAQRALRGLAARYRIEANYSLPVVLGKYVSLYQDLVGRQ